jgi:transaldolase
MTAVSDLKVKIFGDGADLDSMLALYRQPNISGFTTNPTLMHKAGIRDYREFARKVIAAIPDRPISFEVFSDDFTDMERQAREIATWGTHVYVKIPVTNTRREPAYDLIHRLSHSGIRVNVTAILTLDQVRGVMAALRGGAPSNVSVFAGRIADTGRDPIPIMKEALQLLSVEPGAELIWASPRELLNLFQADDIGCHIITVTPDILTRARGARSQRLLARDRENVLRRCGQGRFFAVMDSTVPVDITVIVPAYNESERIAATIEEVQAYFDARQLSCEIIVSADGTDGTRERAAEVGRMRGSRVTVIGHAERAGKGRGIREAMAMAQGAVVGFVDADQKTPIDEFDKFKPLLDAGADVVIGSRALPESRIEQPQRWHRRVGSRGFAFVMHTVVGLRDIRDTQCGFKFFRRAVGMDLFARQQIDGYMFDVEILYLAQRSGCKIAQVPVRWRDDDDSDCTSPETSATRWIFRIVSRADPHRSTDGARRANLR